MSKFVSYNLSFLKDYLELKQIKASSLAEASGVSRQLISKYLKGAYEPTYQNLLKILKVFNVSSYDQLKELAEKDKISNKDFINAKAKYDISFLKPYFIKNRVSYNKLATLVGLPQDALTRVEHSRYSEECLNKLLEVFNVSSYDQLKELIKEYTESEEKIYIDKDIYNSYDISFLKKYLELKQISLAHLADQMNFSRSGFHNIISGKKACSRQTLEKIMTIFNVTSYNELKHLVLTDTTVSIDNININNKNGRIGKNYTIIADYLKIMGFKQVDFVRYLNLSSSNTSSILNGKATVGPRLERKILDAFDIESREQFEELVKLLKTRQNIEVISNLDNNELFKEYIEKIVLDNSIIDIFDLLVQLEDYSISEEDYNTIYLLFNKRVKNSVLTIAKTFDIPVDRVFKLYSDCIQIYLENEFTNYSYDKKVLTKKYN